MKYSELSLQEKRDYYEERLKLKVPTENFTKIKINYKKMNSMLHFLQETEKERDYAVEYGTDEEKRKAIMHYLKAMKHIANYWNKNINVNIQLR